MKDKSIFDSLYFTFYITLPTYHYYMYFSWNLKQKYINMKIIHDVDFNLFQ